MQFNIRVEDLELRSCNNHLLSDGVHTRAEIIQWKGDSCWTLAYWKKHDDVYNLEFVDKRPFDSDVETFMALAEHGQGILDYMLETNDEDIK